jgi:hypothetical protein
MCCFWDNRDEKDPSGVLLIASLSSFVGGMFAVLKSLLGVVEGIHLKRKREGEKESTTLRELSISAGTEMTKAELGTPGSNGGVDKASDAKKIDHANSFKFIK